MLTFLKGSDLLSPKIEKECFTVEIAPTGFYHDRAYFSREHDLEVDKWLAENVDGDSWFEADFLVWGFDNETDAVAFKLRWC